MGCGRVGAAVTVALAKGGHSVAIIDKRAEAFEKLPPGFDARTIVGQGFDRTVLEEAGIREAEGFVAVSNGDNSTSSRPASPASTTRCPRSSPGSTIPGGPTSTSV